MTALTVVGELSHDKTRIVLIANGLPHEVAHAAKRLELATPLIKQSKPAGALLVPATWPAVVQLGNTFGPAWYPGPRLLAWTREQAATRSTVDEGDLLVETPNGLTPRAYQIDAARMIAGLGKVMLFDDPGTGKTISAILGLIERKYRFDDDVLPIVVVCPASVVDHWVAEFRKWIPHWRTVAWRGPKRKSLALAHDVYVCSYDVARIDASLASGPLMALGAKSVVIDECHKIKNNQAKQSKAVRRLAKNAKSVVALSGTPITHHPGDLWPTLATIEPDAWPSRERWVSRYCLTVPSDYGEEIVELQPGYETEFRTAILGQHRRVAKSDVLDQLPPKVYSVRTVELPSKWRAVYDQMEEDMLAALPEGGELSVMGTLAKLTRLMQLSSAPADVKTTFEIDEHGDEKEKVKVTLKAPSWKVDALLEILAERPNQSVLCFAPSRQLTMLAGDAADKAGYTVGYVVGGQSPAERTREVDLFQTGKVDLLCATTGAGGVGLTLTEASTVVFLQRPWSLVDALQAEDRAHRIGSEKHECIEVIDVVAKNTLDARVRAALREKAANLADLVQDPRIVTELLGGTNRKEGRDDQPPGHGYWEKGDL